SVSKCARSGCEPIEPDLDRPYRKSQLVRKQHEAGFDPQNIGGRKARRTRMPRQDRPNYLACGARQHDLEAALAGIAEAANSAGPPGNARAHMRKIAERPKRLDHAQGGKRSQALRTLHRQDRGIVAEVANYNARSGRGLKLRELIAGAAENLEPVGVEAPDR